jgi:hypothetical protein
MFLPHFSLAGSENKKRFLQITKYFKICKTQVIFNKQIYSYKVNNTIINNSLGHVDA